jgi:4-amino-4-deoxy-L-arabinose transferase-like glycosyltransferase
MKKNEIIYKIITHPLFVFPLFFIMLMASNGSVPLIDQDEAAYAMMASEMTRTGDYISQSGAWIEMHRKPPLHIWFMAGAIDVFGNNEFAVRFMTALFSWGTLILIYIYGKAIYYERIAMSAAIICGTCFLFPIYGKVAFTDGLLLFFQTWAAFSLMAMMQWKKFIYIIMFWVAFSLGVLVKGPPIILFTGVFAFLILLLHPVRKRIFRLHPWFFLPLAIAPLFWWGYRYWQIDDGKTIQWMIDWYILKRGKGEVVLDGQEGFPGYYFFLFAFAFLPYFRYFLPGLWEGIKSLFQRKKHPEILMLAIWMISGWWMYEFIPSKLPSYALASLPAISILMAHEMITLSEIRVFSNGLKALSVLEILMTTGLVVLAYFFGGRYLEADILFWVVAALAFLPVASIVSFVWQLKKRFNLSIYSHLIFVGLFWLFTTIIVYPKLGKYWNGSKKIAETIQEKTNDSVDEVYVDVRIIRLPSLPYYISRVNNVEFKEALSWYECYEAYREETPYVAVVPHTTKDTISQFIDIYTEEVNSNMLDRPDNNVGYSIMINDAARKEDVEDKKE